MLMKWVDDIFDLLMPRYCAVCGNRLTAGEHWLCSSCLMDLDYTNAHTMQDNPIEKLFWGIIPVERATSMFFYEGAKTRNILYKLKYKDKPDIGIYLADNFSRQLMDYGFFEGMDMIVPLPLHDKRRRVRGYNQSMYIARGVSQATGLPIDAGVVRRMVNNPTQTKTSHSMRKKNVEDIFRLEHPERIEGRHILLIDDVITTGATVTECAKELAKAPGVRISILSLAYAGEKFY